MILHCVEQPGMGCPQRVSCLGSNPVRIVSDPARCGLSTAEWFAAAGMGRRAPFVRLWHRCRISSRLSAKLHGHLRHERCAAIAFVERPFMGKSSAFVAFINVDGGIMFKVFVGRDETRALRQDQLARFRSLADSIASISVA